MPASPITVRPTATVKQVIQAMVQAEQPWAVVLDRNRVVGIVTQRELIRAVASGIPLETTAIATVMQTEVPTISAIEAEDTCKLRQAFQHYDTDVLVVVGKQQTLIGVLSLRDFLRQAEAPTQQVVPEQPLAATQAHLEQAQHPVKAQQAEFQVAQTKLNDILDTVIAAVCSFRLFPDQTWVYDYCSPGAGLIFGFKPAELMQGSDLWAANVDPEDMQQVILASIPNLMAGESLTNEYRFFHQDGSLRWISQAIASRRDEAANCWVVTVVATDITKQKHLEAVRRASEAALRESQQRYQSLVEHIPGVFYRCLNDQDWTLEYISGDVIHLLGYPASDFLQSRVRSFASVDHPEDVDRVHRVVNQAIAAGEPYKVEYRSFHADGSLHWLEDHGRAIVNANGELRLEGVLLDISNRKHLELALQESEQRYRSLVEHIPGAVFRDFWLDHCWTAAYVNDFVFQICGYPATDFIQDQVRSWLSIVHPEDQAQLQHRIDTALAEQGDYSLEYRIIHADGSVRWVLERGQGIFSPGDELQWIDGVIFDISERAKLEAERKAAEQALQESERHYRSLVDHIPGAVFRCGVDADATSHYLSEQFTEISGYPVTDFIDSQVRTYNSIIHPEDLQISDTVIEAAIAEHRPYEIKYRILRPDGEVRWLLEKGQSVPPLPGEPLMVEGVIFDITQNMQAAAKRTQAEALIYQQKESLRLIIEGTAANIGQNFFRACTHALSEALGVRYAFIAECLDRTHERVRMIAFWTGTDFALEGYEYDLAGTPCEGIYRQDACRYPHSVQSLFPMDQDLASLEVESYVGVPILNHQGEFYGHLAVMDTQPLEENSELEIPILQIVSLRVAAEIERRQAELEVQNALREKTTLLKEVHHRVKNNLQVISSLLRLQGRRSDNDQVVAALQESGHRIMSMALVHQSLYESSNFAQVMLGDYVRSLVNYLISSFGEQADWVTIQINIATAAIVPLDKAVPCGLILNELLTNAFKHGFANPQRQGIITVTLTVETAMHYVLTVSNNGVPLPAEFSLEQSRRSLGIQLIQILAEQLGGQITLEAGELTTFCLSFDPTTP